LTRDPLDTVLLAYDGLCTFEFGIAIELFGLERPELDQWYRLRVARVDDGPLRATGGITVEAPYSLRILDSAGTIIVPGWRSVVAPVPEKLVRKLQRAHDEGARILSVCSGAFVLAETGLLDGKRAATHWKYAEELERRFPAIEVDPDVLYVDEGSLLTSAGSAAGIDLGLHLITRDFGAGVANVVARRLVVPPHREGGQQQFIDAPIAPDLEEVALARVQDLVRARLAKDHTVESMARLAKMSERTFARRFKSKTGITPHRWLQNERVRRVQELLETTTLPLESIATRVGFADAQILRLHFKRTVGAPPMAYRKSFRAK
jgi:AraC family transcriptional activator FtrA